MVSDDHNMGGNGRAHKLLSLFMSADSACAHKIAAR